MILIIDLLKKIKTYKIYKFLLLYLIKPIYNLFWEYVLNFKGKILYFLWFLNKRETFDLGKNDKKLIINENSFKEIANEIYLYFEKNLLIKSKKELEAGIKNTNLTNTGSKTYKQDLFERFNQELKFKILKFAHSEKMISTSAKYIKVFPILDKIQVYHNIPSNSENPRGAMLWHKDDFGYKSLDLFMIITDVDNNNGPLMAIEEKEKLGIFSKSNLENLDNNLIGERGKIKSDSFNKKNFNNILSLKGKRGNALFIDSFTAYHKGGHCKSSDRLMLRLSYQTPDSIRVSQKKTLFSEEFKSLEDKFVLNIFLKHLYFYRPNFLIVFLRNYLIKFYRLLHVKKII